MKISSWLNGILRSIACQLDVLGHKSNAQREMLHTLLQRQKQTMKTVSDIKTAYEEQIRKIDALIALTDQNFQKLGASPVVEDPAVQEVLDMITAHNALMDEAIERDTPADTSSGGGTDPNAPAAA